MQGGDLGGVVYARRDDVVLRDVAGEKLLVPIRNDPDGIQALFALTGTGAFIWGLLDGERALDAVLAAVLDRFDVTPEEAEADLGAFVERLGAAGLVERKR